MEGNKHKVLLTVIGAGTLLIALAGATFAYFSATSTTVEREITTSSMDLQVTADTGTTHIENIKPTTWDASDMSKNVGNSDIAKVAFKVTSSSTTAGTYSIDMTAPRLALNSGTVVEQENGQAVALTGGSLDQVMYKVYKVNGSTYTAVDGAAGELSSLADAGDGNYATTVTPIQIIKNAPISSTLNDQYVIFVYIENDEEHPQNKLQGLNFDITVEGSASQAQS